MTTPQGGAEGDITARTLNLRTKSGYLQRGYHPSRVSKEPSTVDAGLRAQKLERLLRTKTVGREQWWSLMGWPPSARQFWAIMIARFRELDVSGTSQYTVLCTMRYTVKFTVYGIVYSTVYLEPDGLAAISSSVLGHNDR